MTATLDLAAFRARFPEFADPTAWPDDNVAAQWDSATIHIDPNGDACGRPTTAQLTQCLYLMTAHLLQLVKRSEAGVSVAGVVTGAAIDKVNVQLAPPPSRDAWGYWLAQTTYGQQLAGLMSILAAGGFYIGANVPPERSAFRKAGGVF